MLIYDIGKTKSVMLDTFLKVVTILTLETAQARVSIVLE